MMRTAYRIFAAFLAVSLAFSGMSCQKPQQGTPDWPWVDPEPKPDTIPTPPPGPDEPEEPEPQFKGKPRYVWIDASANFRYYANSESQIEQDLLKIKAMGFTDVIVDVRPTEGTVLFKSDICPAATKLAAWVDGQYKFVNRTETFDFLQAFIEYGHKAGLRVNAAINTFVCGYSYGNKSVGPVFTGEVPAKWATVVNTADGLQSSFYDGVQGTVFMNPANADVREFMLSLIGELAAYKPDGIILDRCRYDDTGLGSDFSEESRKAFEAYIGRTLDNWPSDVFAPGTEALPRTLSATQKSWMSFRVKTIHDFVEKASLKVHSISADTRFGCYVGAWYADYYPSGVNWASPDYNARNSYSWADADYSGYGFADHCDFMMLGCYAGTKNIYGNGEWSMQGFAKLGKQKIGNKVEVSGGPDIGNASGFESGGQGALIPKTIDACINSCDGYFVFDLCHIRMYDYWSNFKTGIDEYLKTVK
ncbi:MAG: family 10 glycosylhydrolase [Bacteroidales bacterium]|nr:family 10 glycosylhydrolase [Bacteroidales bacterium]